MDNIVIAGCVIVNGKQFPIGWDKENKSVYVTSDPICIKWEDTYKVAASEEDAKEVAKEYYGL